MVRAILLRLLLLVAALMGVCRVVNGKFLRRPRSPENGSGVSALFVLGDSSVDCGDNTLFYPLLHQNLSLLPCNGSDSSLLPHFLVVTNAAEKMGLPYIPTFYSQNGSIEGLLSGLNYGSAQATIMKPSGHSHSHQSLNQQLRQVFETLQLLQLQLSQETTNRLIQSSIFYLSFGKDDYINLFQANSSGAMIKYSGRQFAHFLVRQMVNAIRNLYDVNVQKIICMGILPLGCTPRTVWERQNITVGQVHDGSCVDKINELVLEYNTMLDENIVGLNTELPDARIIFCDVYQGIMEIISRPQHYGFEDVRSACCGLGLNGAMIGCMSVEMACDQAEAHVWWDLYNPTQAVNSLLADSAWSGLPFSSICRPSNIHDLVYT